MPDTAQALLHPAASGTHAIRYWTQAVVLAQRGRNDIAAAALHRGYFFRAGREESLAVDSGAAAVGAGVSASGRGLRVTLSIRYGRMPTLLALIL
jgi:hypothetical protein